MAIETSNTFEWTSNVDIDKKLSNDSGTTPICLINKKHTSSNSVLECIWIMPIKNYDLEEEDSIHYQRHL